MRLLVATHHSNGVFEGDYDSCVEGELVYMQDPCDRDLRDPNGGCGCGRGFAGMNSHRATTTAMVVDSPLAYDDVWEALRSSLEAGGWLSPELVSEQMAEELLTGLLADIQAIAECFPVGSIVRRNLQTYSAITPA